jgi:DNA-binding transcriptional MerR regulator
MRIGELATATGTTPKAVRYYESLGLLEGRRLPNGYRDYDEHDVRLVREIRALGEVGIRVEQTRPFLECLLAGGRRGDDCAAPLEVYRAAIRDLDDRIELLRERRDALEAKLRDASDRGGDLLRAVAS